MKKFTVWVGGTEVTDYIVSLIEANEIAEYYINLGYEDVKVEAYEVINE